MNIQIPEPVDNWLLNNGQGEVDSVSPVSGGSINQAFRLKTNKKFNYFLKINKNCPPDMFLREAEGLELLDIESGPRVPKVHLFGDNFILLEDIRSRKRKTNCWKKFGQQLVSLHQVTNLEFGLPQDNYIGSTPQSNYQTENGFEFFANQRLIFQAELAAKSSLLTTQEVNFVFSLASKLIELIPLQKASLIHGDLWGGNLIIGPIGEPVIIDPAAHFAWPEADLAMTTLFGSFPVEFYRTYEKFSDIEPDWQNRADIYNLYHLLNHLNIFGMGYHASVMKILKKYA
ncbi:MAG: phosphotransferase [Chloroflexi bacterium]|nr:phosphotransferase [Chloroflexota bacterium]MBT3669715.1 phosphotransferase [Chloroflexota bacterium]MBT4004112.1 phosphotransferase [Chloroflexota bacterium]MBT4305195.1 phosphotransferase [Chloroflexota bacterium]MBT4534882.1 phosphotransferase [Chloroflexota bacterium]